MESRTSCQARLIVSCLFFIDDLVFFSKSNLKHDRVLREILEIFCEFSRHKNNARKTNIFFSKGVEESTTDG